MLNVKLFENRKINYIFENQIILNFNMMRKYLIFNAFLILFVIFSCSNESSTGDPELNEELNNQKKPILDENYKSWVDIGRIEDGNAILTADKNNLIKSLNQNLFIVSGSSNRVSKVSIEKINDSFYLLFTGGKMRVAFYVEKIKGSNILRAAGSTSCSTTECSQEPLGCIPEYPLTPAGEEGIGICTPCENGGKCTKTVSARSLIST